MSAADKDAAKAAIAAYLVEYADFVATGVDLVNLRGYVRSTTKIDFGGPTLASFLKQLGYRREGYRPIDTCPGRAVFYVKDAQ